MPTYLEYSSSTIAYLESEWPAVAIAVASCEQLNRAAVRSCLDAFMRGATVPEAAASIAFAVRIPNPDPNQNPNPNPNGLPCDEL